MLLPANSTGKYKFEITFKVSHLYKLIGVEAGRPQESAQPERKSTTSYDETTIMVRLKVFRLLYYNKLKKHLTAYKSTC